MFSCSRVCSMMPSCQALQLRRRRQLAEHQQVRHLEVRAVLGQLLDGVAAVLELALVAVDVGDRASARGGVGERRVVRHQPEVVIGRLDLAQVHGLDGAVGDRHVVLLAGAVVGNRERVSHRVASGAEAPTGRSPRGRPDPCLAACHPPNPRRGSRRRASGRGRATGSVHCRTAASAGPLAVGDSIHRGPRSGTGRSYRERARAT